MAPRTNRTGNDKKCNKGCATTMLKDLNVFPNKCFVKVIVLRTWDVVLTNANTFDFFVMNTDGDQIHGWVQKKIFPTFEPHLYEYNVVHLQDFRVVEKKTKYYCPMRCQYNIELTEKSKISSVQGSLHFPKPRYEIVEFGDFRTILNKKDYLSDVVGMLEQIEEAKQVSPKNRVQEIYIRNAENEVAKITFWNDAISQLDSAHLNSEAEAPMLIVTSLLATSSGGKISLNSTMSTKLYVNPNCPQPLDLKERIPAASPGSPEKRLISSEALRTTRDIRVAVDKKSVGFHLCRAIVIKVFDHDGWQYPSSPKCRKRVSLKEEAHWCFECKDWVNEPVEKYMIQIQVSDRHGNLELTAFDDAGAELTGISFEDMATLSRKPKTGDDEVREKLQDMVGKSFEFRVRISNFNLNNQRKSLTATSTTRTEEVDNKRLKTAFGDTSGLASGAVPAGARIADTNGFADTSSVGTAAVPSAVLTATVMVGVLPSLRFDRCLELS